MSKNNNSFAWNDTIHKLFEMEQDESSIEVKKKTLEEKIELMKSMQQNTIDDEYDTGFFNGIEYCLGLLEDREENYKQFKKK